MQYTLAVLLDTRDQAAEAPAMSRLQIWSYAVDSWLLEREEPFTFSSGAAPALFRSEVKTLLTRCAGCQAVAAASFPGIINFEIDRAGLDMWEVNGAPWLFLPSIFPLEPCRCGKAAGEEPGASVGPGPGTVPPGPGAGPNPGPDEYQPGKWRVSLLGVQGQAGGPTSKQLIMPLLQRGEFASLEIICTHVPVWLELLRHEKRIQAAVEECPDGSLCCTIVNSRFRKDDAAASTP